jgi:FkbM family methyltransferase
MKSTAAVLVRRPDRLRYWVVLDPRAEDWISRMFAGHQGHLVCDHLLRLMLAFVEPGDVVLDLGAHIGTFALPAAAMGCRVIAVEPSPANVALLEAAVARNRFGNVEVVAAAACSRSGRVSFRPSGPHGYVATRATSGETVMVTGLRVDDILRARGVERVAFVKMDVEGSELRALRGMSGLLSRKDAPPILYEANGHCLGFYGSTPNAVVAELERHGYRSHLVEGGRPGRLVRVRAGELQAETVADHFAVKSPSLAVEGWQLAPRLDFEERITRLLAEATSPLADHRRYAARVLAEAGEEILSHRLIAYALDRLRDDPAPAVRAAASWWPPRGEERRHPR